MEALLRERCEAVVLLGSRFTDDGLAALAARVPTLLVARRTAASGVGVVRGDDLVGIGLAVDHLVGLGHRSIAHVDGADAPGSADRRLGFDAAMARHGLGHHADVLTGGLTEAAGARAMTALLARPAPPSAVIAFNDRCATGVVDTLVHRGRRVPGDVSVVGYDDSRLAEAPHVADDHGLAGRHRAGRSRGGPGPGSGGRRGADGNGADPPPGRPLDHGESPLP